MVTEPLFTSPLAWKGQTSGLAGVSVLNVNAVMSDLTRCWSHNPSGNTFSTITASFYQAPELLITTLTPNDVVAPYLSQKEYIYGYDNYQFYSSSVGSVSAGASTTAISNTIVLNSIPRRVYIYFRQQNLDQDYTTSDVFGSISAVTINWNNNAGLLSAASAQQLHQISVKNGCDISWPEWNQFCGSVLALDWGKDIGCDVLEAPSVLLQNQLQVQATFTNPSANAINYTMYLVTVQDGVAIIKGNNCVVQTGILSKSDVLNAKGHVVRPYDRMSVAFGAGIFDSIKNALSSVGRFGLEQLKKNAPYLAERAVKYALTGSSLQGDGLVGGRRKKRRSKKGSKKRGRGLNEVSLLSRKDMKKNVKKYDSGSDVSDFSDSD